MTDPTDPKLACPIPAAPGDAIQMAHGGGGRVMQRLLDEVFLPAFMNPALAARHDAAVVDLGGVRVALTTDAFVVSPLFFPGGDIGRLAVFGTVNDLAVAGARPAHLSVAVILEEGFPIESLRRVVASMRAAADEAGVDLVTGDTKVVERGKGDGLYVTTTGIGAVRTGVNLAPSHVRLGDVVIVSGDLGRHGIAILSVREGLGFEGEIASDCASLAPLCRTLLESGAQVHCLRDLTRGGLSAALNEVARDGGVGIDVEETRVPVSDPVRGACEILGLDPLYVANEGRLVAFVAADDADCALAAMRSAPEGAGATTIGRVTAAHAGEVQLEGPFGGRRCLDLLSGEQLPRIC
ncbi:MAG: hydrogenase expression/formation protein HypE [Planctomycetota bacterium]|jgi:hydrogenase expression/formation protein HypE